MTEFAVLTATVATVKPHPNADRLELVTLKGSTYQYVAAKGQYEPHQIVICFPSDAVLPNELAAKLGLPVKPDLPFRVKPVRLRGEFSEGVLAPVKDLWLGAETAGIDLTDALNVTKYELPEEDKNFRSVPENLIAMPDIVRVYDIENLQRYPDVYLQLAGEPVAITEKLEGSNWWAHRSVGSAFPIIGQRRYAIKNTPSALHPYWQAFYDGKLDAFLDFLTKVYPTSDVTIRGEIVGTSIQGNYYGLKSRKVYLFEIEVNGKPINASTFYDLTSQYDVDVAPLLSYGVELSKMYPDIASLVARAHGKSILNTAKLREGIVIRPLRELYNEQIGRCIVKVRDAEYLAQ